MRKKSTDNTGVYREPYSCCKYGCALVGKVRFRV